MSSNVFNQIEYCPNQQGKKDVRNFEEVSRNSYLSVKPSKLEFTFDLDNFQIQTKIVDVTNYFSKPCPIQLLPLETQYFQIRHTPQRKCLNPGSIFNIHIFFTPNGNRDYNDILRIRYIGCQLAEIKIHAKLATKFSFPTNVNFGNVPLGRTAYYEIPIHPHVEKEFSFAIVPCKGVSSLDIYPRWGRIAPGQKPTVIKVIYRPVRYVNMNFQVRIYIYDLLKAPHVINFYAHTRPGLLRESIENAAPKLSSKTQRGKIDVTTLKAVTKEKDICKSSLKEHAAKFANYETILLKQCGYLPPHTLHGVNCVLNSKTRKLFDEYELKGPLNVYTIRSMAQRSEKLIEFLTKVECHYRMNEQAKFHNKVKLNYTIHNVNENQQIEIKMQHREAWEDYKRLILHSEEGIFEEPNIKKIRQRILRPSQMHPTTTLTRPQTREADSRYCAILPFLQAARKIILKYRLLNILAKLRALTAESIIQYEECCLGDHLSMLQS